MKKFVLLVFVFVVGCAPKIVDLNSLCKNIHNSYECAQKIEKYQLSKYEDYVKRVGDKLILKINNKSDEILEDSNKDTDESVSYTFRDYLKEVNLYFLSIHFWEGGSYYLINRNSGESILIPGLIKISPNLSRIVSYNIDIEARYSVNGFVIYKLTDGSFIKEFEIELDDWGPSNAKWINNNQIEFEKSGWTGSQVSVIGKVRYEYSEKWKVID